MKRNRIVFFACLLSLCMLAGCGNLRTYNMSEILPAALDDATLLPIIESVTVTRVSDGVSVTVTGTEVELLMLAFENLTCTRTGADGTEFAYALTFQMADSSDIRNPLYVTAETEEKTPMLQYGEYTYDPITPLDLFYIDSLFG